MTFTLSKTFLVENLLFVKNTVFEKLSKKSNVVLKDLTILHVFFFQLRNDPLADRFFFEIIDIVVDFQ